MQPTTAPEATNCIDTLINEFNDAVAAAQRQ